MSVTALDTVDDKKINTKLVKIINDYWAERGRRANARIERVVMPLGPGGQTITRSTITRSVIVSDLTDREPAGSRSIFKP